ncbi:hypothetical protein LCGC14_1502480 [marine sediment metagenome]|uniref:PD-(D/E)XK endonuclease-like domain-containing protein n=1 Tax=marine sediment metagenome TaxID=412755 RepID=A0A0F9M547_9ZZZZ
MKFKFSGEEWKKHYKTQISLLKRSRKQKSRLRFKRNSVIASDVGSQLYCEKKVEMGYLYGTIKTESMVLGSEGHEAITEDSIKVDLKEAWKEIFTSESYWISELLLLANYKNLYLAGRPDTIFFAKGAPVMIFEFKFSKYRSSFPSHHIQAETYGIILNKLGFDTSSLFYTIVILPPYMVSEKKKLNDLSREIMLNFWGEKLYKKDSSTLLRGKVNVFIQKFDIHLVEEKLDKMLEFWKKEREAIPTDNQNKCLICEFKKKCDFSLIPSV